MVLKFQRKIDPSSHQYFFERILQQHIDLSHSNLFFSPIRTIQYNIWPIIGNNCHLAQDTWAIFTKGQAGKHFSVTGVSALHSSFIHSKCIKWSPKMDELSGSINAVIS